MKTGKLPVAIMIAALLVAYYFMGTGYRAQHAKNTALSAQIGEVARQLAEIPPPPTDLATRRAAASANVDKEMDSFPPGLNSTRIVNDILKLAEICGVRALPVVTQPWAVESISHVDYPVFRLNIAIKGTFEQVSDFLSRLENGEPTTLVMTNLSVEGFIGPGEDNGEVEASMDIAVYARPSLTGPAVEIGK